MAYRKQFENYHDYLKYCNENQFTAKQRCKVFQSATNVEQLKKDFIESGWKDVQGRNIFDEKLNELNKKHKIDLLEIRYKAIHGKSVYLFATVVLEIFELVKKYDSCQWILSNLVFTPCKENNAVVLVTYQTS